MLLPVSLLVLLVVQVHGECTRKIIVIPLFHSETECDSKDCGDYVENFVHICTYNSQDTSREQIALFLPPYNGSTTCYLGVRGDCGSIQVAPKDVVLLPYTDFSIEDNLAKQLKSDSNDCIDESMAVVLTDIPCSEYSKYPDLQQIFGDQFAKTLNRFNNEFYLNTVVFFLTADLNDTKNEPCPAFANHTFNPQHDFIQYKHIMYEDVFNKYENICDWTFLTMRNRTATSSPMNQALTTGLIIGCSIVGLLIIGLTAFCGYKVRRRYLQSKLDMFAEEHASRARRLLFGESKLSVDQWELTPKELKVEATVVLGTGVSATVYKGRVKKKRDNYTIEMDVAVKFAHSYADQSVRKDMIREIQFMKTLGQHDNLLVMIGCVKDPENPVIATEYCAHGDLLKVLRKHELHYLTSERCEEVDVCLLLIDLLRIASQVCAGMVHLSSLKFVHRAECPEQLVRLAHTKCFQKMPKNRATFEEIQDEIDRLMDIFDI
ncbi:Protein tyrosine kinase [Aphelenchoides besseyi]|nr:Protein tyrosine kinase [Aphelenchoides besseyi]